MRLAVAVFLIQNERLHIEDAKLIQRLFVLITNRYSAQASGVRDDLFQIRGDHQSRAFAIDARDTLIERRRRKAASGLEVFRDCLQLIEFRRSDQDVAGDPNIELFVARFSRISS